MQVVVVKRLYGDIADAIRCKDSSDEQVRKAIEKYFSGIDKYEPEGARTGYFECESGHFEFTVMPVRGVR